MKTNAPVQNIPQSLAISPLGRNGTKGSPINSSPDKGRLGGVSGFTLVELIIVITILAILATIAFMSFQGYMKDSRDAVRVSDLTSASKGLTIFFTKAGVYPETESGITLTASGTPIGYQGYLGQSVARAINMNQVPLDPVDQTRYIYSTSTGKTKFQLMGYTENSNLVSFVPATYAIDYSVRGLAFQGDELGVVLNNDNSLPTSTVETASGSSNFKVLFDKTTKTEGSGNLLFSQIYNMRDDLINKKELASLDNSLVGYWDMETLTGNLLKDWSKYGNHGTCYESGSVVDCGGKNGGPQFVSGEKSMNFDGNDLIQMSNNNNLFSNIDFTGSNITIFARVYTKGIVDDGYGCERGTGFSPIFSAFRYNLNDSGGNFAFKSNGIDIFHNASDPAYPGNDKITSFHSVVFTKNNFTGKFYTDGLLKSDSTFSGSVTGSYTFNGPYIGGTQHCAYYLTKTYFKGFIDEVRIYNRALSDSEIKALYQATQ